MDNNLNETLLIDNRALAVRHLYDKYAAMLLGYIMAAVKDRAVAEQYLITVFNDIPNHLNDFLPIGNGTFCRLQVFTRKKLAPFFEKKTMSPVGITINIPVNKYHDLMSEEHNNVFCGLHYHGKTTAVLAQELNKPEAAIRNILKEALTMIRKGHQL